MKGHNEILEKLNELLADELTAVNQYMVHAEMCSDWGYERLHEAVEKRAIEEMKHTKRIIERIIFLEGKPIVSRLNDLHIGGDVGKQISNDHKAELDAIAAYNDGIRLCIEKGDSGSRELLESILGDEEAHIDWLESQTDQIEQMGMGPYLAEQLRE